MATNANMQATAMLKRAQELIAQCLKSGSCSNELELEVLTTELAEMRVDVPLQISLMLDAVRYFYIAGKPSKGLEIAEQTREFAVETAHASQAAIALTLLGVCSADTGNLPKAMEAYADALSLAQRHDDTLQEAKIWQNLGAALLYSGLFREAIGCFSTAFELVKRAPEVRPFVSGAHANIALCHLNLDEITAGLSAIRRAVETLQNPSDAQSALNRVLTENYYTRLLLEAEDFEAAREHAKAARHFLRLC
jgi:tetratricopeptide (TPR) repeat protein